MPEHVITFELWESRIVGTRGEPPDAITFFELDPDSASASETIVSTTRESRLFSTEESRELVASIETSGHSVSTLPRAAAVCCGFSDEIGDRPAVVVSVGIDKACAWLTRAGRVLLSAPPNPDLGLVPVLERALSPHLRRLLNLYRENKGVEAEEQIRRVLWKAVKEGEAEQVGPLPIPARLDFSSSLERMAGWVQELDPDRRAGLVILVDGAAGHGNLAELLGEHWRGIYQVLAPVPEQAFHAAVRGLALYHWRRSAPQEGAAAVAKPTPAALEILAQSVEFLDTPSDRPTSQAVRIRNSGGVLLEATVSSDQPWLACVPPQVSCAPGQESELEVGVDGPQLEPNQDYSGNLRFNWNDSETALPVRVSTAPAGVLSCHAPECQVLRVEDPSLRDCPTCGSRLRVPSLKIWRSKCFNPLTRKGPVSVADSRSRLVEAAVELELDSVGVNSAIDDWFRKETGTGLEAFATWLRQVRTGDSDIESRTRLRNELLGQASRAGVSSDVAQAIVDEHWPSAPEPPPKEKITRPEPSRPPKPGPRPKPRPKWLPRLAVLALVLAVVLGFLGYSYLQEDARPSSGAGTLVVRVDPPAFADLDGFDPPEGGIRIASTHRFVNVSPGSHRIRAWRDGYENGYRTVTVEADRTIELQMRLDK